MTPERMIVFTKPIHEWIENILSGLPFIKWDRFTKFSPDDSKDTILRVFGWIDRKQDSYKDFAVLEFVWDTETRMVFLVSTSSSEYSLMIDKFLAGDNSGHEDCVRVENHFKIQNSVRLD